MDAGRTTFRGIPGPGYEASAMLLTLLVALHLVVYSETRSWLTAAQSVDAMRRWYIADGGVPDALQRVTLSSRALPVAVRLADSHPHLLDASRMRMIFADTVKLDALECRLIYHACESALRGPAKAGGI